MRYVIKPQHRAAFSLVELSIVLVILGLLTGGILAGQSLIRAAEIRSVSADMQRYQTSVNTFRDKYFGLPGDVRNATSFWGVRAGTGSDVTCHQTMGVTTGTCNGNGDGQINLIPTDNSFGERFAAWQQLAYAGLVEGSYTGASTSTSSEVRALGVNVPASKISSAAFSFSFTNGPLSGDANFFDGPYRVNMMHFFHISGATILKPEEVWNIDTKLDDGRPATGRVINFKSTSVWNPGCTTTAVASTAEYALTATGALCNLHVLWQ